MVSIIVCENSVPDMINAGLTKRLYEKKGEESICHIIKKNKLNYFWNNINKYLDTDTRSSILINIPPPTREIVDDVDLGSESYVIYMSSKNMPLTKKTKDLLLENGITIIPQRESYRCFPGNYNGKIEKKWMNLSKNISFEHDKGRVLENNKLIINGLIETSESDPLNAIDHISQDDIEFFIENGEIPEDAVFIKFRCKHSNSKILSSTLSGINLLKVAIQGYLENKTTQIGVEGAHESIILTESPSYSRLIFQNCNVKSSDEHRFGSGVSFKIPQKNEIQMAFIMGKISPQQIVIVHKEPKAMHQRTLKRRLVGGDGPEGRAYHGLSEIYPGINVKPGVITAPSSSYEHIIDILLEAEAKYQVIV